MGSEERDLGLEAILLAAGGGEPRDDDFQREVMEAADLQKRRKTIRRIALGLALGLLATPLQDLALDTTQVLATSLVQLEGGLVDELLAPINTVGSLLSVVLLSLRTLHRRIFLFG